MALFIFNSILLGVGLAMDAFSVSIADAMAEPCMSQVKKQAVAGTFAAFQCAMPLTGWVLVKTLIRQFRILESYVPWIALILLSYIGIKMIIEGIRGRQGENCGERTLCAGELIVQGIATSIDALSAGLAMAAYSAGRAVAASVIIAVTTFLICTGGLFIGGAVGRKIEGKASIVGGLILIAIGLEIFFT